MMIDFPPTEIVCEISDQQQNLILKNHFYFLYHLCSEYQFHPEAGFKDIDGMHRCHSGIPFPFLNGIFGYPNDRNSWDQAIDEQSKFFNTTETPFCWFVDEDGSPEFKEKLKAHGFHDTGIFRGVIGFLDQPIPDPKLPDDCTIELIQDEVAMDEFIDLQAMTFGFNPKVKELAKIFFWEESRKTEPTMYHWAVRKEGKIVSAVTTFIQGNLVSFWNGASSPEMRRQGFSTALGCAGLRHAVSKGCRIGMSYLMAEGLALGICTKLGSQTKWYFNVYVPSAQ